jgi:hypothetical protein
LTWRNHRLGDELRPWLADVDLDQYVAAGSILFILRVFRCAAFPRRFSMRRGGDWNNKDLP